MILSLARYYIFFYYQLHQIKIKYVITMNQKIIILNKHPNFLKKRQKIIKWYKSFTRNMITLSF